MRTLTKRIINMAKVNISLSQDILDEIDKLSKENNMTRSELLRSAFKTYLEVLDEKKKEEKKTRSIEKAIRIQKEISKEIGDMDFTEDLRKWREKRK